MQPKQFPKQQPPREAWRIEIVDQQSVAGLVLFEYAVREPNRDPFLLNNHKAQIRTNHQRIVRGPNGGMMHVSGVEVMDAEDFEKGKEFYRWVDKDRFGAWRDDQGRTLPPFVFPSAPWAGGGDEELDPQWQRETFTLSEAAQVQECLARYQDRMAAKGYVGDRRGTTLNLQVGAGADDAWESTTGTVTTTGAASIDLPNEWAGFRWQSVTVPAGATIDEAIASWSVQSSTANDEPLLDIYCEDADSAAQFTTAGSSISSRARTTATQQWSSTNLGAVNTADANFFSAPTVKALVQEVTDRGGWASGNNLVILITAQAGNDGTRDFLYGDYSNSSTYGTKLDIDYTAGGGDPEGRLKGGKLIRGGLLRGGVL